MARMIEEFERKSELKQSRISSKQEEQQVLKMSEKLGSESILIEETYNPKDIQKRQRFDGNESVLTLEDTVEGTKFDRRGTLIDIHTNDATLFNLGYTARITTVHQPDLNIRKGSTANLLFSAVDSAKDNSSIRLSGGQLIDSSLVPQP